MPTSIRETRARLLNRRGWAYHFADAPRLASDDFEASLKLMKDQSDALAGRGLARIRLGDWGPAMADAEAAVRLVKPESPGEGDRDARVQAYLNAARIYAQAVEFAAGEVSRQGERAVSLYRTYRARALDLLQQALREVPADEARPAPGRPRAQAAAAGPWDGWNPQDHQLISWTKEKARRRAASVSNRGANGLSGIGETHGQPRGCGRAKRHHRAGARPRRGLVLGILPSHSFETWSRNRAKRNSRNHERPVRARETMNHRIPNDLRVARMSSARGNTFDVVYVWCLSYCLRR